MMKKLLFLIAVAVASTASAQQWLRVWQAGDSERFSTDEVVEMPYSTAGSTLTIGGTDYATAEIDSITIVNPVTITWDGASATVDVPATVEGVSYSVSGSHVVIDNANVTTEQEFVLVGSSTDGSLTYNGAYKCKFHLNGVSLTSTTGAALDIQCGKRIDLDIMDGTTNSLTDCANGTQKAALNCQGHLEVSGSGTLNIAGNTAHGMRSKEYLILKKSVGAINVTNAVNDAIHCGEFFTMNGGTLTLSGYGADGLQMETAANSDEPDNGTFTMNGGYISITHTSAGTKAIRADSTVAVMNLDGGTIHIDMTSSASDAKGIACDGDINISQQSAATNITINVAGAGYTDSTGEKIRSVGIKCDDTITMNDGNVTVNATGTYARGMRAATLVVNGGTITVTNTGTSSQGIKLDNTVVRNGGNVYASFKY